MFGFNRKKRMIEGPVEFTTEVEINRSAAEVFPLIDIADPRFRHSQTGAKVTPVKGTSDCFDMAIDDFPDAVFKFRVLERIEGQRLSLDARMEPRMFALVSSIEETQIEPTGDTSCLVKLTTKATFDESLSDEDVAGEIAVMSAAVTGDLEKLAVLAEDGLDALKAMEEDEMGIELELGGVDLGELDIDWDDIEPRQ